MIGVATPSTNTGGGGGAFPGYPWYAPVFIGDVGYYGYGWWGYDYSAWPYYDSYDGYAPYDGYYALPAGPASGQSPARVAKQPTGAIRLKVNPDTASVYVDGSLVGKAGDFDGLLDHHLVLERGSHVLEIRADGYETVHKVLTTELGKTMTERVTLKKK